MGARGEQFSYRIAHAATPNDAWFSRRVEASVSRSTGNDRTRISATDAPGVAESTIEEGLTTLMLTDLPYALTLADIRDEMAFLGFGESYDYIYYPMQKKDHFRGYCFVNFVSTSEARLFAEVFVDHKFEFVPSSKRSNVALSRTQGIMENLAKLSQAPVCNDNCFIDLARIQYVFGHVPGGIRSILRGYAMAQVTSSGSEAYSPRSQRCYGWVDVFSFQN
eukprot:TRINITY_DN18305_c0_g1_i1.p1 TRINITY_DN18305_c0_g1~~TRINITY_DN18305_c0_g1_i1.p1  ORF type:complete len:237 (+),score=24.87 TRINITY_DN18305_c0_g1_i1:49-711(+)